MRQDTSAQRCTHSSDTASRNANGDIDHVILTTFFDEMTSSNMPIDPKCEDPGSADGVPAENLLVHSNEWKDPRSLRQVYANSTQPLTIQSTGQQQALSSSSSYSEGINQPVAAKRARFNDRDASILPSGCPGGMQTGNTLDFSQPSADHNSSTESSTSDIQTQILEAILRLEQKLDDVQRVQAQQQATINTLVQQNDRLLGYASTTQQALVRNAVGEAENMNMALRPSQEKAYIPSSSIPGVLTRFSSASVSTSNGDNHLASAFDFSSNSAASKCGPAALNHVTFSSNDCHCRQRHSEDATSSSSPVSFHRPSSISSDADDVQPSRRPKYAKLYADLIRDPSDPKMGLVGGDPNIKMAAATYAQLFRKKGGLGAVRFLCSLLGQIYGEERLSRMSYAGKTKNGHAALKGEPAFNAAVAQTKRQFPGFEMTAKNTHSLCDKIAKLRVHLAKANVAGPEPLVVERAVDLDEHG